jgi:hypothetical protein
VEDATPAGGQVLDDAAICVLLGLATGHWPAS